MSSKTKFISVLSIILGIAMFSTVSFAQDGKATTTTTTPDKVERHKGERGFGKRMGREGFGGRHGKMRHMMGARMLMRGIDLTDAQKAQIKAIREGNKPDAATMAELKAIHESRKAGTALTVEQQNRMKAFREQRQAKMKAAHEQILNVLTVEQKAKIETRKAEMKQRFAERKLKFEERRKERGTKPATTTDKPKDN
ncbi:MAG: Spy/CpxP family protein refolding chaperone [Chloracidobacterium sp.]|nr:Spy/CpxP family protein refolding chaperone [Chloracidobacterium sp.]